VSDRDDLFVEATAVLGAHDPELQPDNGYLRCALCHYTRHPCDAYAMAAAVLVLLEGTV